MIQMHGILLKNRNDMNWHTDLNKTKDGKVHGGGTIYGSVSILYIGGGYELASMLS